MRLYKIIFEPGFIFFWFNCFLNSTEFAGYFIGKVNQFLNFHINPS